VTATLPEVLPEAPPLADPAARGRLTVADRVVERIAAQAAAEVDAATGAPRRRLGVPVGGSDDRPRVTARVDGDVAVVGVEMAVAWPAPVLEVTGRVRERVVAALADLAGVRAAQVDVRVTALTVAGRGERRVD
jgi:uncharacterized alkaline shock family protein YloU